MRAFLTVGVLGGYTTFSTFSLDSALLIERGAVYAQAAAYIVGSVVLSILALFAGLWMVRAIYARDPDHRPDDDGIRLDRWFKRHYPALSPMSGWKSCCARARCGWTASGPRRPTASAAGQTVRLPPQVVHAKDERPQKAAAQAGHPLASKDMGSLQDRILYMDKQVIVLDKPPGLATQGGSGLTKHVDGMLDSLQYEKPTRPQLVHRLDRDTSGVLLIARTAPAASGLSAVAGRCATPPKIYWALIARRAQTEAWRGQGGAGQGRRPRPARPRRAHGVSDDDEAPNSPSPNMP